MSDAKKTPNPMEQLSEAARASQKHFEQGYEAMVRGLTKVTMKQLELSRTLMEGAMEDLNMLSQARTPDALVTTEMEVLRRRAERTIGAFRAVADEMGQAWGEALETAPADTDETPPPAPNGAKHGG